MPAQKEFWYLLHELEVNTDSRQLTARCACLCGLFAGCTLCASGLSGQGRPFRRVYLVVPLLAHAVAQETLRLAVVVAQM